MLLILAVVAAAVVITIKKKSGGGGGGAEPVPGPPGAITQKYSNALKLAVQFFDVQKCTLSLSLSLSIGDFINVVKFLLDLGYCDYNCAKLLIWAFN